MLWIFLILLAAAFVAAFCFMSQASFGKLPDGERLERISASPQYRDGRFHNSSPTEVMVSGKSKAGGLYGFLFDKIDELKPLQALPMVKTDLAQFGRDTDVVAWLGHSSLYMQLDGVRFLVDPVLVSASPVSFVNRAFEGTDLYTPDDIPPFDYLVITHDHWDHLDYETVMALKERLGKVICPLGVGSHFEYWGFNADQIIELDWNESIKLGDGYDVHCLPARHFSGRSLTADKTLWASFMISSPSRNVYISGDTGYDSHFKDIAAQFGQIDLAVMENGQYNEDWKYIHLLPEDLVTAIKDLNPERVLTVHNSKYALGKHSWHEPMDNISEAARVHSFKLLTPKIGEPVHLQDSEQIFEEWWKSGE